MPNMLAKVSIGTQRHRVVGYTASLGALVELLMATEVSSVTSGLMSTVIVATVPAVIGTALKAAVAVAVRVASMMKVVAATTVGNVGHVVKEDLRGKKLSEFDGGLRRTEFLKERLRLLRLDEHSHGILANRRRDVTLVAGCLDLVSGVELLGAETLPQDTADGLG